MMKQTFWKDILHKNSEVACFRNGLNFAKTIMIILHTNCKSSGVEFYIYTDFEGCFAAIMFILKNVTNCFHTYGSKYSILCGFGLNWFSGWDNSALITYVHIMDRHTYLSKQRFRLLQSMDGQFSSKLFIAFVVLNDKIDCVYIVWHSLNNTII